MINLMILTLALTLVKLYGDIKRENFYLSLLPAYSFWGSKCPMSNPFSDIGMWVTARVSYAFFSKTLVTSGSTPLKIST